MRAELARLERAEGRAAASLEVLRARIREIRTLLEPGEGVS